MLPKLIQGLGHVCAVGGDRGRSLGSGSGMPCLGVCREQGCTAIMQVNMIAPRTAGICFVHAGGLSMPALYGRWLLHSCSLLASVAGAWQIQPLVPSPWSRAP